MSQRKLALNLMTSVFAMATCAAAATTANTAAVPADNTQKNERDYKTGALTAQDQARGSAADIEITRRIRQDLVADKSFSINAQNVKIITLNGVVTLRGPVASKVEKLKIGHVAKSLNGVKKVDNQIEIKVK